jgi:hypothetical protein
MEIEVSIGEIVDKLSILDIKMKNIEDVDKLKNIEKEFNYLNDIVFKKLKIEEVDYQRLVSINTKLWIIEKMIQPYLFMDDLEQIDINIKNKIIGWALKQGKQIDFVLAGEQLEGRRRIFTINVVLDGEVVTAQKGYTKKDASQLAAQKAIEILGI